MINTIELENGKFEVTSTLGFVSIGCGAVKALILDKDELEYVTESDSEDEQ